MEGQRLQIADEPLRRWILEAYQEYRKAGGAAEKVLSAMRQYLSGPPGSQSATGRYWFEEDPEGATRQFVEDLEAAAPGLACGVCELIFQRLGKAPASEERGPPPGPDAAGPSASPQSPAVVPHITAVAAHVPALIPRIPALAARISPKAGLGKPLECAVVSTVLLGISRMGTSPFEQALSGKP